MKKRSLIPVNAFTSFYLLTPFENQINCITTDSAACLRGRFLLTMPDKYI